MCRHSRGEDAGIQKGGLTQSVAQRNVSGFPALHAENDGAVRVGARTAPTIVPMKAVIAQLNLFVGDLKNNSAKILEAALSAYAVNADLLLTSELSICSYQPEDLLLKPSFISACKAEVEALAKKLPPKLATIVGLPWRDETGLYNAAEIGRAHV